MSFKNLRSPATNSSVPTREPLAPIPITPDPSKNDERVDTTEDHEGSLEWPRARFDADNPAAGGNRPPMRLK